LREVRGVGPIVETRIEGRRLGARGMQCRDPFMTS